MGIQQSKSTVKKREDRNTNQRQSEGDHVFSLSARNVYFNKYSPLHKAALKGNWESAETLLIDDPTLVRAQITRGGETALHIAALEGHDIFVSNLLERMKIPDMDIQNKKGNTALCFAAAAGHVHIAKKMVDKNQQLPTVRGCNGVTPLYMAVLQGHTDMAEYLFDLSGFQDWTKEDQISLLTTSIGSQLYDLAMRILVQNKMLAIAKDSDGDTALEVLARNPLAFCGSNRQGLWTSIANTIGSSTNPEICDAYKLFDCLWDNMIRQDDVESDQVINENISNLPFIAVESGNDGFLIKLIHQCPDFLYEMNTSKHSIFHIAVSQRHVKIFNLIYELSGVKDLITAYVDENGDNILHLAARLAPQNQLNKIPGPALQIQREVLWYKAVENIVQPLYRSMKNSNRQTPYDLFLTEHGELMKEGEKFMKQTAKSCMLVTLLITTLVFSTAFTVPGGYNNNTGEPILENNRLFVVFPVSQAVATLSSLTSMLMFLTILTSRYEETDFLNSLPFWLVIGVGALLISIVAMMVEFCTCLLLFEHGLVAVTVLLVLFASVPVIFVILNYPLLGTILGCTYGGRWLFRSENHLFS